MAIKGANLIIVLTALLICLPLPAMGAEKVEVVVTGAFIEALANVQDAAGASPGLVREEDPSWNAKPASVRKGTDGGSSPSVGTTPGSPPVLSRWAGDVHFFIADRYRAAYQHHGHECASDRGGQRRRKPGGAGGTIPPCWRRGMCCCIKPMKKPREILSPGLRSWATWMQNLPSTRFASRCRQY